MKTKLHIGTKMFLKDPYVVRVEHPGTEPPNLDLTHFRKFLKTAKSLTTASWGYSNPEYRIVGETKHTATVTFLNNHSNTFYVPVYGCYSYWAFTDELDALQFRLTVGENAAQMYMWPANIKFTITEYIDDKSTSV